MNDQDGTVFLIDDDPGVRDALTLLLSLKGMSTQPFATADSFIEAYRPERAGCVLTDLRMPGMTGLELLKKLREKGFTGAAILLTAHVSEETYSEAARLGVWRIFHKPVESAALMESVAEALSHFKRKAVAPEIDANTLI